MNFFLLYLEQYTQLPLVMIFNFREFDIRPLQNSIVLILKVTTTRAFRAESRSNCSKYSNYNKTPNSIIWVKLSMVIDRECLEGQMIIKFSIRHGVFVQEIEIESLWVANAYSLSASLSATLEGNVRPSLSAETGGILPNSPCVGYGLLARRSMSTTGL